MLQRNNVSKRDVARRKLDDDRVLQRQSTDKRTFSNGYFKSFIQPENKRVLVARSLNFKRSRFIPEKSAKDRTMKMRYDNYMDVLERDAGNSAEAVAKMSFKELARRGRELELKKAADEQ